MSKFMNVSNETDIRNISKGFIVEFLQLYKSFTCLWKIKSAEYCNRTMKRYAYQVLVKKFREVDRFASRDTVVKKIDSMRGSFRKEYKKYLMSLESGNPGDVYKPKLWYYDCLTFLKDQEVPLRLDMTKGRKEEHKVQHLYEMEPTRRMSFESIVVKEETASMDDDWNFHSSSPVSEIEDYKNIPQNGTRPHDDLSTDETSQNHNDDFQYSETPRKRAKLSQIQDDVDEDSKLNKSMEGNRWDDDFDTIGRNIANKLRNLPREARIVSEKLMMDILFQAELGYVNRHTTITMNTTAPIHDDE